MDERMVGAKCEGCGRVYYPKRVRCPNCGSERFDDAYLGDECVLLTFTKLYAVPEGVERVPLVIGVVEFKNGARAIGQILEEKVYTGMKLRPDWGSLRKIDGREVYGFRFKPL